MFGKSHRLNELEARKQLLIIESEVNRAQLNASLAAFRAEVQAIGERTKYRRAIVSSATSLAAGLASLSGSGTGSSAPKSTWLQNILKGANLLTTLWLAWRSNRTSGEPK